MPFARFYHVDEITAWGIILKGKDDLESEVVDKLRLGRDVKIWKLLMLGRTQKEAGEAFGVARESVRDIGEKLQTQISAIQNAYYKDKKTRQRLFGF